MDSRKAVRQAMLVLAALGAGAAFAHPNHAEPGTQATLLHLLTEPDHALALIAAVAAGLGAMAGLRRRSGRKGRGD